MDETNRLSVITNAVASIQHSTALSGLSEVFTLVIIGVFVFICFVFFSWLYFLPTSIIRKRKRKLFWAMFIANLFFGVTGLGWIICLIVALSVSPESGPAVKIELG